MGLSSSSTTSTTSNEPWAPAQPYILKGMQGVNDVFDQNQPVLQGMSSTAQQAFNSMAPSAFSTNPFVQGAEDSTSAIYNGAALGQNPGVSVYASVANGSNPASAGLASLAATGGSASPSAQYYSDVLSGKYLNANPYIDGIAQSATDAAAKALNQRFAATGMGAGLGSPYADLLTRNVAAASNNVRYQNYNDQLNRMTQVGSQADGATNAANQIRLGAGTTLGSQYNQDLQTKLAAGQAADSSFNTGIAQVLQAAAMAPALRSADYAGVSPALALLNSAADIPYVGTAALNGQIRQASNGYGTSTGTTISTPSLLSSLGGAVAAGSSLYGMGAK